jgi:hypothetical protein
MMVSVTFAVSGAATFVPTYVGEVAVKAGLSAPYYAAVSGLHGIGVSWLTSDTGRSPIRGKACLSIPEAIVVYASRS